MKLVDTPEPTKPGADELADAIVSVAASARKLLASRLNLNTTALLIQHGIPSGKRPTIEQIKLVLESAADLAHVHLKKRTK